LIIKADKFACYYTRMAAQQMERLLMHNKQD